MAIYVFNLLVGYFPCGVDNAQGYRAKILDRIGDTVRYIFTEIPSVQDIEYYRGLGIPVGEMLSAHQYFTDNCSLDATVEIDAKLRELKKSLQYTDVRNTNVGMELLKNREIIASVLFDRARKECIRGIMYFKQAKLIRSEFYTGGLLYAEYFVTATSNGRQYAKLVRRTYFSRDGIACFDMIYDNGEERYLLPDGRYYKKSEFMAEFIKRLKLTEKDTVIIDRFSQWEYVQPLFQFGNKARFIAVFHTGHYFEENEGPAHLLYLNEEYYYPFRNAKFIDTIVVSTEEQKKELQEKLTEYGQRVPEIAVIPAGGIQGLRYPETVRKPYSLIAVSRLARSRRIQEIIRSVVLAHERNPEISLDIYGSGEYEQELCKIVEENSAQRYIRFAGYQNVTEIYKNYEVLLTASFHETFGLAMLEAISSGLAMIGWDAKYGNHLFIHPGKNGYLIALDLKSVEGEDQRVKDMAEKIVEIFRDRKRLDEFSQYSYRLAGKFLFREVEEKWKRLLADEKKHSS